VQHKLQLNRGQGRT